MVDAPIRTQTHTVTHAYTQIYLAQAVPCCGQLAPERLLLGGKGGVTLQEQRRRGTGWNCVDWLGVWRRQQDATTIAEQPPMLA